MRRVYQARLLGTRQPPGGRGAASNSFIAPNKLGGKIPLDTFFPSKYDIFFELHSTDTLL